MINRLAKIISDKGTLINLSTPVLGIKPRKEFGAKIITSNGSKEYDLVISTIPLPLVGEIFRNSGIDEEITSKYESLDCVACACVIFKTRKKLLLSSTWIRSELRTYIYEKSSKDNYCKQHIQYYF